MDYVAQRTTLRRPLTHVYRTPWDLRDLDGGCQVWRRFREKEIDELGSIGDGAHSLQIKQFELTKLKHATAESMWRLRMAGNADRASEYDAISKPVIEEHTANELARKSNTFHKRERARHSNEISSVNESAIEDDSDSDYGEHDEDGGDGEDDDNDDNVGTIYSWARLDSPSLSESLSKISPSGSCSSTESFVAAPCTVSSMSHAFRSFDWSGAVDEAADSTEQAFSTQTARETAVLNRQGAAHPILISHVQHAWSRYENERLSKEIENNRTLGQNLLQRRRLSCCSWKPLRLLASLDDIKEYAQQRPITGRCISERTPIVILTNEDDEYFELLEVIQILSDEEIALIRLDRDPTQISAKIDAARYHYTNAAAIEGQNVTERHATAAARTWWQAEQKARTANYIDREHDEAREEALLLRQIEHEAEMYLRNEEISRAIVKYDRYRESAAQGQVEALARLKMTLQHDGLVRVNAGTYIAARAPYSVRIVGRAWRSCLARFREVGEMVKEIQSREEEEAKGLAGQQQQQRQRSSGLSRKRPSGRRRWRHRGQAVTLEMFTAAARRKGGEERMRSAACGPGKSKMVVGVEGEEEKGEGKAEGKVEKGEKQGKKEGEKEEIDWVAFMLGYVDDI